MCEFQLRRRRHNQCHNDDDRPSLLSVSELPAWMRDNDYIETLYRPQLNSALLALKSGFFWMTNETINVWTHALAALFFIFLSFVFAARCGVIWFDGSPPYYTQHLVTAGSFSFSESASEAWRRHGASVASLSESASEVWRNHGASVASLSESASEVWRNHGASVASLSESASAAWRRHGASVVRGLNNTSAIAAASLPLLRELNFGTLPLLIAAAFCTACSTAFHVFWPLSPRALKFFGQLDFVGIATLCAGHAITSVFFAFYCRTSTANKYYAWITIVTVASLRIILSSKFRAKTSRNYRAAVFCFLGASIIVPVLHAGTLHKWTADMYPTFVFWMTLAGIAYVTGAFLYALRVPECCRPGKHDRLWASHQLMHIAVIFGACFHTYVCHLLIRYRIDRGCSLSPLV